MVVFSRGGSRGVQCLFFSQGGLPLVEWFPQFNINVNKMKYLFVTSRLNVLLNSHVPKHTPLPRKIHNSLKTSKEHSIKKYLRGGE